MDPISAAAFIGAGTGLIGGHFDREAQKEANEKNIALTREQMAQQKEFAQQGVRWKVQDAVAAGIHPLAALGAQTSGFSPISTNIQAEDGLSRAVGNMGQDISRAVMAKTTQHERQVAQLQLQSAQLDVEGKAIENQIRASQLQKMNFNPPPLPSAMDNYAIPGQANGAVKVNPAEITASDVRDLSKEAGTLNDYTLARTSTGGYVPVPSKDIKERIEDSVFMELPWAARHFVTGGKHKSIPEGYDWNPVTMQYEKDYHKTFLGRPFKNYWKDFKEYNFKRSRGKSLRLTNP